MLVVSKKRINSQTILSDGDWIDSSDLYGGQGLKLILTLIRQN